MRPMYLSFLTVITVVVAFLTCASAQVNNAGQKPYLGWSSFSQQTIQGGFLTQANMITQSDALKASGLQDHGFVYVNLDSGWQGSFDANGRPIPDSTKSLTSRQWWTTFTPMGRRRVSTGSQASSSRLSTAT